MSYSTLISFYGPKPPNFGELIEECQALLGGILGSVFRPYDLRQVHCTIAALDRAGCDGLLNAAFLEFRGQRVAMDLPGMLRHLLGVGEIPIQLGGFATGTEPFLSRGQPPDQRSFIMREGKAVLMGWPIAPAPVADAIEPPPPPVGPASGVADYPPSLENLRRGLQRFGILHRYHARPNDIDNDFYVRLGLYEPAKVSPELHARAERQLRDFLSARQPLRLSLRRQWLALAQSGDQTLPLGATALLPITHACDATSAMRLFGWDASGQ